MPAAALEVLGASHRLAEHTSQMQWFHRKLESCRISDQQQITKQWPSPFFLCKFGFGKCFGTSIPSSHWADHCWLSHAIHFSLQFKIRLRNGLLLCRIRWHFKTVIYLNFWSAHEAPTYQAFHISNLFQTANDHKMVWVEFLGNFLCNCKRISFGDALSWSLSTSNDRPVCFSSRLLFPWQNFLNHHCTVHLLTILRPNVLLLMQDVSGGMTHFELE